MDLSVDSTCAAAIKVEAATVNFHHLEVFEAIIYRKMLEL